MLNKSHLPSLRTPFTRLLLASALLPPLLLAAPGCTTQDGDLDDQVEDDSAPPADAVPMDCDAKGPSTIPIFVYDRSKQGRVLASLAATNPNLVTDGYEAVLIHVDASNASSLAPAVTSFLNQQKHIVLDSSGDLDARRAIAELAGAVTGMEAQETALSILQYAPGSFTITPLDTNPTFGVASETTGNKPLALLGSRERAACAQPADSADAAVSALVGGAVSTATDSITKIRIQPTGKPTPPIVYHYIDNKVTHALSGTSGSDLKRYLYRGDVQKCPSGGTKCNMSFSRSFAKAVANGTSVSVKLGGKLTELLTGDVTLGYSLTLTNTKTLTWTNAVEIKPGLSARPVSYLWRRSGYGNVKNAYVFKGRTSRGGPCRPAGCTIHTDTYTRDPSVSVATWSAYVPLNQGSPTNSWNIFSGNSDPNSYTFD